MKQNKHSKPNAYAKGILRYQICLHCYESGVYYVRTTDTTVKMVCSNCDKYIKWAIPEEYAGKEIVKFDYNKLF